MPGWWVQQLYSGITAINNFNIRISNHTGILPNHYLPSYNCLWVKGITHHTHEKPKRDSLGYYQLLRSENKRDSSMFTNVVDFHSESLNEKKRHSSCQPPKYVHNAKWLWTNMNKFLTVCVCGLTWDFKLKNTLYMCTWISVYHVVTGM